ncbi:haloacid dehalogenase-like hydrolase [Sphingomonas aurantiaca]|uniref:haloacid dehalogenase-like hydrolase n=1 Tax=Sphingomonas aurantiaca TaxID=185949 RepID=UPI003A5C0F8A
MPYRSDLLAYIAEHRAAGGQAFLVTASPRPWADAVAHHLGVFDDTCASTTAINLKGLAKAEHLAERFGPQGSRICRRQPRRPPGVAARRRSDGSRRQRTAPYRP